MINRSRPVAVWYGGSFDPPHQGHQMIVDRLVGLSFIDCIIITPTYLNPFKSHSLASAQQRLKWCRTVFDDPKIFIDPGEVNAGKTVYTAQTLQRLSDKYDIRYLAIGSDNLYAIETWYDFDRINDTITWLVFERDGYDNGYDKLKRYQRFELNAPVSSSQIRDNNSMETIDQRIIQEVQKTITKGSK